MNKMFKALINVLASSKVFSYLAKAFSIPLANGFKPFSFMNGSFGKNPLKS